MWPGIVLPLCACFHPSFDRPACGPNDACPDGLTCSARKICEEPAMGTPDAGFDSARCPASYNAGLPGPSRYRLIAGGQPAWVQSDACAADLPGATHLAVLESQAELDAAAALLDALPTSGSTIWIGAVQQRTAVLPADSWLWFDGVPLTTGWSAGEPNDGGSGEADHRDQFVDLQQGRTYFTDSAGSDNNGALCECDGVPIAQAALDAITSNRP
jgi:hypothetical protein